MKKKDENILLKELKVLFLKNEINSFLRFQISKINENFGEYCLTLICDNYELKGIFSKTKKKLEEGQIINCKFYLDKSNEEIKVYAKHIYFFDNNEKFEKYSKTKAVLNFMPEYLKSSLKSLELFEEELNDENVFIILNLSKKNIKLFDPIKYQYYYMDSEYTKNIIDIKKNDFIYFKYHSIIEDNIICNNLTFIHKANDFQIFTISDKKISNNKLLDFYEVKEIIDDNEKNYSYIFAKVILKSIKEKYILIVDKFNRIIRLDYKQIPNLELFDLLIIINCKLKKYKECKYYYELILTEKTITYKSGKLILNKKISINNYSILNIKFPDFNKKSNYYNKLILSDSQEINVKDPQQIYIFKFKNEIFNEIVPFVIKIKNESELIKFKFFIMHNLMTNINLFANYKSKDKCSVEYCYYNIFDDVPFCHDIIIDEKNYTIDHYNSFDNTNQIGFILINAPPDKNIFKIKRLTKKNIISSQVWLTANKYKEQIKYEISQILDIDEARPKKYLSYSLDSKKYKKFENFYFDMSYFLKEWNSSKNQVYNYFEELDEEYELIEEKDFDFILNNNNIDYYPESADFYLYKMYANLLLFNSLRFLKNKNKDNRKLLYGNWSSYLGNMIELINELNNLGKLLTYHQKIRILDSYNNNFLYSNDFDNYEGKFFYIDEKTLNDDNAYLLAFKFNIDVIQNLNDKSILTKGYKQLDSYILTNYLLDDKNIREEKTYSLINEPISLMKYHLLMNYENFVIIKYEPNYTSIKINSEQDDSNRVTFLNERAVFDHSGSKKLKGEDNALPISMVFFQENSHSKKSSKNNDIKTPLSCYIDNQNTILKEREDGKYIESLIGDKNFIDNLKDPFNKLGVLMKVDYFIKEDFNELYEKFTKIIPKKIKTSQKLSHQKTVESDPLETDSIIEEDKKSKKEDELVTLEDFEEYYLEDGIFVYPDSIPFHKYPYGKKIEISEGEKAYLEKYKEQINFDINNKYTGSRRKLCV